MDELEQASPEKLPQGLERILHGCRDSSLHVFPASSHFLRWALRERMAGPTSSIRLATSGSVISHLLSPHVTTIGVMGVVLGCWIPDFVQRSSGRSGLNSLSKLSFMVMKRLTGRASG